MRVEPAQYPEVGRLDAASYCNPFFGFRLSLPSGIKQQRYRLPVQEGGRHLLLALYLLRLDRPAGFSIAAFADATPEAARLAALAHRHQKQQPGATPGEVATITVGGRKLYRLRLLGDARRDDEIDYFLDARGWVVRFQIMARDPSLEADLSAAVEKLAFFDPADDKGGCASGALYYGPALPTDLVAARIAQQPGHAVPAGDFTGRVFAAPFLALRVTLPDRWQPLSSAEREKLPELLAEPGENRRHDLLRACSRVVFGAYDPLVEPLSGVHPALAVAAMPLGCDPSLVPPPPNAAPEAFHDFAHSLLDSLGLSQAAEWKMHTAGGLVALDGAMPYRVPGESLARRLSLRISVAPRGQYLLLLYSVTTAPAEQRSLDQHILLDAPVPAAKE